MSFFYREFMGFVFVVGEDKDVKDKFVFKDKVVGML